MHMPLLTLKKKTEGLVFSPTPTSKASPYRISDVLTPMAAQIKQLSENPLLNTKWSRPLFPWRQMKHKNFEQIIMFKHSHHPNLGSIRSLGDHAAPCFSFYFVWPFTPILKNLPSYPFLLHLIEQHSGLAIILTVQICKQLHSTSSNIKENLSWSSKKNLCRWQCKLETYIVVFSFFFDTLK